MRAETKTVYNCGADKQNAAVLSLQARQFTIEYRLVDLFETKSLKQLNAVVIFRS